MRVTIPDALADTYQSFAAAQGVTLDDVITRQLDRFKALEPGKKAIVIRTDTLIGIEHWLGTTPLRDGHDLIERLRQHGQITFETINLELSHGQKLEIQHRADRQGKTVAYLVQEMADYLKGNLFWNSGGGEAKAPIAKVG